MIEIKKVFLLWMIWMMMHFSTKRKTKQVTWVTERWDLL